MTRTNSQPEGSGLRAGLLLAAMLGALVYLAACLYQIQVRDSHLYIGAQNQTSIRRVRLPATRGRILDRNGLILADNRPRYCAAFYLDELRAPGRWSNTVARVSRQMDAVAAILDRPREIEDAGIWSHLYRRRPIPLIAFRDLDEVALARLAEWPQPLAGVDLFVQQDRVYPYGDLACHIIGYVGKGNPTEKPAPRPATPEETDNFGDAGTDADFDFYLPDLTGREGIEKSFDAELAGRGDSEGAFQANWHEDTQEWEIINVYPDESTQLPGGEIVPQAGDTYIPWNFTLPQEYINAAEQAYAEAVDDFLATYSFDTKKYNGTTDRNYVETNSTPLKPGWNVRLLSEEYFAGGYKDTRITKVAIYGYGDTPLIFHRNGQLPVE